MSDSSEKPVRGDPTWVAPALTKSAKTRVVGKTNVFFGPHHGLELTEPERLCLAHICQTGFMSPLEISELPFEVGLTRFECDGLDKVALATKLEAVSFADLVAVVESLGF